jgi:rubrerythrin
MKDFSELTEQELLALAIALEEEDNRTYGDMAEGLRENYPGTAKMFAAMAEEENGHRHRLLDLYRQKFGDHIPLIRRQDVKGLSGANRSGCSVRSGSRKCAPRPSWWIERFIRPVCSGAM